MHTNMHACMLHTYPLTYLHTYIHTYIHTCIHTYTHLHIHIHIYIYILHKPRITKFLYFNRRLVVFKLWTIFLFTKFNIKHVGFLETNVEPVQVYRECNVNIYSSRQIIHPLLKFSATFLFQESMTSQTYQEYSWYTSVLFC